MSLHIYIDLTSSFTIFSLSFCGVAGFFIFVSFNVVSLMFVGLADQSGKSLPEVYGLLNNLWRSFV